MAIGIKSFLKILEHRFAVPSYSGMVLFGFAFFFFIAATNTMAGWLYVMSGLILALLGIATVSVRRNLRGIRVDRPKLEPVQAGDVLSIRFNLHNDTGQQKSLIQVIDALPPGLGTPHLSVVEALPARRSVEVQYDLMTQRRGVYRWQRLQLRTGAPLGLVWGRRTCQVNAVAIVHPRVLSLACCPLIDRFGTDRSLQQLSNRIPNAATSGQTRSLRPYRWGDSTRLIHWRTSARLGELRVRELETFTSGQSIVIALDSAKSWDPESFEQAVTVAATLYFYAQRQQLQVQLWTASSGLVNGDRSVLDTLAATNPNEMRQAEALPDSPILWLTSQSPISLPPGSRSLLWTNDGLAGGDAIGINSIEPIDLQLMRLGN